MSAWGQHPEFRVSFCVTSREWAPKPSATATPPIRSKTHGPSVTTHRTRRTGTARPLERRTKGADFRRIHRTSAGQGIDSVRAARGHHVCPWRSRAQRVTRCRSVRRRTSCRAGLQLSSTGTRTDCTALTLRSPQSEPVVIARTLCTLFNDPFSDPRSLPCSCWVQRRFWPRLLKNHRRAPA
jgi:hypothetical protein